MIYVTLRSFQKVTPEMAEAMVARLQAKVQKTAEGIALMSNSTPPARYMPSIYPMTEVITVNIGTSWIGSAKIMFR